MFSKKKQQQSNQDLHDEILGEAKKHLEERLQALHAGVSRELMGMVESQGELLDQASDSMLERAERAISRIEESQQQSHQQLVESVNVELAEALAELKEHIDARFAASSERAVDIQRQLRYEAGIDEQRDPSKVRELPEAAPDFGGMVRLNVGGRTFETLTSTLQHFALFEALLSGRHAHAALRDRKGAYFLDRDGELFALLLNAARNGMVVEGLPRHLQSALEKEALFYGLELSVEEQDTDRFDPETQRAFEECSSACADRRLREEQESDKLPTFLEFECLVGSHLQPQLSEETFVLLVNPQAARAQNEDGSLDDLFGAVHASVEFDTEWIRHQTALIRNRFYAGYNCWFETFRVARQSGWLIAAVTHRNIVTAPGLSKWVRLHHRTMSSAYIYDSGFGGTVSRSTGGAGCSIF